MNIMQMQYVNFVWNYKKIKMRKLEKFEHYIFDNIKKSLLILWVC